MTEIIDGVTYTIIDCDNYGTYSATVGDGQYPSVTGVDVDGNNGIGSDTLLPNTMNKFIFTKSAWILHGSPANIYIKNFEVLGHACFKGTNVEKVYIGNTIRNQTSITALPHHSGLLAFSSDCFRDCPSLNSVVFEDYTGDDNRKISINGKSFRDTVLLTSIVFPRRTYKLEGSAIEKARGLQSVIFEGTDDGTSELINIRDRAFEDCPELTAIALPLSLTYLGVKAFKNCTKLTDVTFPNGSGLTIIKGNAFENTGLTNFVIPATVTELERNAWKDCPNLQSVTFHPDTEIATLGGTSLEGLNVTLDADGHRTFIVPSTVALIGTRFLNVSNVTRVIFAHTEVNTIPTIVEDAFNGSSVTSISVENTLFMEAVNLPTSSLGTITLINRNPPKPPICFPAGTPVTTDQGLIAIEKLNTDKHTIRGKEIVAITQSRPLQKHIVCFEKDSLNKNVPSQQTLCSMEHKVFYKGEMTKARNLVDLCENVTFNDYNGETLFNVLLKKHDKMMINNLICETLHPENIAAKISQMKDGQKKNKAIQELTKIIKENNVPEYQKLYASL